MADIKKPLGSRTSLPSHTAHNSLPAGTYVSLGTITHNTNQPLNAFIEVNATAGASVSNGKQLIVFAKISLDGTNFTSGPESGTSAVDEKNLIQIGVVPLETATAAQSQIFNIAAAYDGDLPYASKIIVKNDTGATLGSSGNSAYYAEITSTVA